MFIDIVSVKVLHILHIEAVEKNYLKRALKSALKSFWDIAYIKNENRYAKYGIIQITLRPLHS